MLTTFIMISERLLSSFPTAHSGPPQMDTPKPKIIEATIRGSILLRLKSSGKSLTVRKLTISSPTVLGSPTSSAATSKGVSTGGNSFTAAIIMMPAIMPVTINVTRVEPSILPSRFMLDILPTAEAMEMNTIGTTTVNIAFTNISPRGASTPALSPSSAPAIQPSTMEQSSMRGKR